TVRQCQAERRRELRLRVEDVDGAKRRDQRRRGRGRVGVVIVRMNGTLIVDLSADLALREETAEVEAWDEGAIGDAVVVDVASLLVARVDLEREVALNARRERRRCSRRNERR